MIFTFGPYTLNVDVERTREFYARDDIGQCTCQDCQNYRKAILQAPAAVHDFFRSLGIDLCKPTEVFNVTGALEEDGTIRYNGWLHVCGIIVECPETKVETVAENGTRVLSYRMDLAYRPDPEYPFSVLPVKEITLLPDGFPTPAVELEIDAYLPWVITEDKSK